MGLQTPPDAAGIDVPVVGRLDMKTAKHRERQFAPHVPAVRGSDVRSGKSWLFSVDTKSWQQAQRIPWFSLIAGNRIEEI